MPDIAMCTGHECQFKEICYRYRAISNTSRQSWMQPPGTIKDPGHCKLFLGIKKYSQKDLTSLEECDTMRAQTEEILNAHTKEQAKLQERVQAGPLNPERQKRPRRKKQGKKRPRSKKR